MVKDFCHHTNTIFPDDLLGFLLLRLATGKLFLSSFVTHYRGSCTGFLR